MVAGVITTDIDPQLTSLALLAASVAALALLRFASHIPREPKAAVRGSEA